MRSLAAASYRMAGPPAWRGSSAAKPLMIEHIDQRRDGVARPPASLLRGLDVRVAISHRE